jgi:hypothetical protein
MNNQEASTSCSTPTFGKRLILHSQAREIVANVVDFMKKEAEHFRRRNEPLIPLKNFRERIMVATGITKRMYTSISKESTNVAFDASTSFSALIKKRQRKKYELVEGEKHAIRTIVNEFHITEKRMPTINVQDTTSGWSAIRDNYVRSLREQAQHAESGFEKIRPYNYEKEQSFVNKSKELITAEGNFEDDRIDNVVKFKAEPDYDTLDYVDEIKTEPDGSCVYLPPTQASFEDNVNKTSHDQPDHASEVKTEEIDVKEEELSETNHNRADYVSEVKIEPDGIDIEEELCSPFPINSVGTCEETKKT